MEMEIKIEIIEATNGFIIRYGEMYVVAKGCNSEESRNELRKCLVDIITEEMPDLDEGMHRIKVERV